MSRIAVTGPRPHKLGGYEAIENFKAIRRHMRDVVGSYTNPVLVSGGAVGVDQLWMEVGLYLQVPVIAALPFEGYNSRWPAASRQKYEKLLAQCEEVLYICEPGYDAVKMQTRNEWMVNNSDVLVAYWNGMPGGTHNCIKYALEIEHPTEVFNLHEILIN